MKLCDEIWKRGAGAEPRRGGCGGLAPLNIERLIKYNSGMDNGERWIRLRGNMCREPQLRLKWERMQLLRRVIERLVLMDDRAYTNTIPTFSNMCDEVVLIRIHLKRLSL